MSEHDGPQASTKRRRSRSSSKQNGIQAPIVERPATDDKEEWKAYWRAQGQEWRIEPEIDIKRQQDLEKQLADIPIEREEDFLFFEDVQLSRADIEWLLATQKKWDRIVSFNIDDEQRQRRESLTLCGADLRKVNLSGLPMERVNLFRAHLEGVNLRGAHLEEALLIGAHLKGADLTGVHLEGAYLGEAHLEGVPLFKAHLEKASLNSTHLEKANLFGTNLEEADLVDAHLEGADLRVTYLTGARLMEAHLEEANLEYAHLESADLFGAHLEGAHCCRTFFDTATRLNGATLSDEIHGSASLAEVSWGNVNLTVVDWSQVKFLGDESIARELHDREGKEKDRDTQIKEYQTAIRANRQLAVVLQNQGLNEVAARFAYSAQKLQRHLLYLEILKKLNQISQLRWLLPKEDRQSSQMLKFPPPFFLTSLLLFFLVGTIMSIEVILTLHNVGFQIQIILMALIAIVSYCVIFVSMLYIGYPFRWFLAFVLVLLFYVGLLISLFFILFLILTNLFVLLFLCFILSVLFMFYLTVATSSTKNSMKKVLSWCLNAMNLLRQAFSLVIPFITIQVNYGQIIFSLFLDLVAGFGYRPGRTIFWYVVVIFGFTTVYSVYGHLSPLPDALVFSLMSFHGRGFFPSLSNETNLHNPLVVLAAFEAVIGLFIEISFIATFTKRFFGS